MIKIRVMGPMVLVSVLALAACDPRIPDSAAGIGDDTSPFNAPPEIEPGTTLDGYPLVPGGHLSAEAARGTNANWQDPRPNAGNTRVAAVQTSDDIARETAAALSTVRANSGQAPIEASPANPAPVVVGNPGLSDENDFAAVAARQTIESDAERLARQRAQYQQVTPTLLPDRPVDTGPNIVNYALSTTHSKGTRVYSRTGINMVARSRRNCAEYASSELAQLAFLEMGGPKRDRRALDPDGDGYACGWDPRPYRSAVRGHQ